MSRFKAAGIHLVLSVLIALIMLVLVFWVWYPGGYYKLLRVDTIYFVLMGVDVCLGPLLTLAVYKQGKRGLKFDLVVIAIVQLGALLYGAYVVFIARPVFNVFEDDVFKVTLASEMDAKNLAQAKKTDWQKLSIFGPVLVAATGPTTAEDRNAMIFLDWSFFPKLYVDYDSRKQEAFKHAKPLADLRKLSAESAAIVDTFVDDSGRPVSDFMYLPIVHTPDAMTAVLDAKTANFIDIIEIDTP
ncbi:MAG TPA: TfpX/TfpZ family type IV pilin accessory protein [Methylotenera sp.]|nr:TfpX/TfpZ family type IV pilin accessory protein [Methylotenera sp.]HPH05696.1 TfpX/TfpZ family type IV pilin accessory protein [Methylotenera sp.]HPN01067.1 TfpX/TfpZ family type IV pilin accessory protein [Methylotenera sp.]